MIQSKVKLLPLEPSSSMILRGWRNDERVFRWCRQNEEISLAKHERWFNSLPDRDDVRMYGAYADGELVGVCGLTSIDLYNRRAEFSLYIGPEHQGNGYGFAALYELLYKAFKILDLNLVWGESFDGNPAEDLFKAIGFTWTGKRRSFYYRHGQHINANLWDITSDEFEELYGPSGKFSLVDNIGVHSIKDSRAGKTSQSAKKAKSARIDRKTGTENSSKAICEKVVKIKA